MSATDMNAPVLAPFHIFDIPHKRLVKILDMVAQLLIAPSKYTYDLSACECCTNKCSVSPWDDILIGHIEKDEDQKV